MSWWSKCLRGGLFRCSCPAPVVAPCESEYMRGYKEGGDDTARELLHGQERQDRLAEAVEDLSSKLVAAPCAGCAELTKSLEKANQNFIDQHRNAVIPGMNREHALEQALDAAIAKLLEWTGNPQEYEDNRDRALAILKKARGA